MVWEILVPSQRRIWDSTADQTVQRFKETGYPVLKSINALTRGILNRRTVKKAYNSLKIRRTQSSCSNQFILWISWVFTEQWRIRVNNSAWQRKKNGRDGLSAKKKILTSVSSRKRQLLVSPPKKASGNSLHENILSFETLSDRIQFSKLCENAWLKHRVTREDGWTSTWRGGRIWVTCSVKSGVHTFSSTPQSWVFAAICGWTILGPVVEVKIVKILTNMDLKLQFHRLAIMRIQLTMWIPEGRTDLWMKFTTTNLNASPAQHHSQHFRNQKDKEFCVKESKDSNKKNCAHHVTSRHGNSETCANNFGSPTGSGCLFPRILRTEELCH